MVLGSVDRYEIILPVHSGPYSTHAASSIQNLKMRRASVKWLVLNEFCEMSELMTVVERSQYTCTPFRAIGIKTNMRAHTQHSPEATIVGWQVILYPPCIL